MLGGLLRVRRRGGRDGRPRRRFGCLSMLVWLLAALVLLLVLALLFGGFQKGTKAGLGPAKAGLAAAGTARAAAAAGYQP